MLQDNLIEFIAASVSGILSRENIALPDKLDADTIIFGEGGVLDSMMLVELMLALEDYCSENGLEFVWGDDSAMSARRSVYRTVGSLAEAILEANRPAAS